MKIIGMIPQTICILVTIISVAAEYDYDYPDYESSDFEFEPPPSDEQIDNAQNLRNRIDIVTKLYGNESNANFAFWDRVNNTRQKYLPNCGFVEISLVEELKAIAAEGSTLDNAEKTILASAADKDIENMLVELDKMQSEKLESEKVNCTQIYENLRNSRSHLECALGKKEVAATLADALDMNSPQCWEYSQMFWKKLLQKKDFDSKCNATLVYSDVIRIGKVINQISSTFTEMLRPPFNDHQEQLGGALVTAISSPKHVKYLTSAFCPNVANPWECEEVSYVAGGVLCTDASIQTVRDLETLVHRSRNKPFDSFEEAEIAMEILEHLIGIVHLMSVGNSIMPRFASMSVNNLDVYMDIMDYTIGKPAEKMWSKLSKEETIRQLARILSNNDKYVWSMSRIFFSSEGQQFAPQDLAKDAMALKLRKIVPAQTAKNIAFDFDDAAIQTNFEGDETKNGLNVYAIRYQTLAELIQQHGVSINSTSQNSTKEFVGKGGIISLAAHQDTAKVSLPVSYRMNFQKSDFSQSEVKSVCLSCEYLDLESGLWSNEGCSVRSVDEGGVICDCNHTTNFAAFMSPVEAKYDMTPAQYQAEQIVSYVGSALSVLALAMCLIIFNLVKPSLQNNERVKAHISLTFALLIVHMTQLASDLVMNTNVACITSAVVTHYFLLAAFLWMLIEGIFLYLYVVQVFVHSSIEYLRLIYALGWIIPGVIVIVAASIGIPSDTYLELNNQSVACGESEARYPPVVGHKFKRCWLSTTSGMAYSFIIPALVIILVNSVILAKVFQVLMRVSRKNRRTNRPFSPGSTFSSHNNKAFGRKEQMGRVEHKSDSVSSSKGVNDSESSYGSTSAIAGKAASADHSSPNPFPTISSDKTASPQHYMHNPSYMRKHSPLHEGESSNKKFIGDAKTALKGALVLLPILGIPWICGLWAASNYVFTMIFLVLNATQGIFIFIVYCLMNGEVMRALRRQVKVAKLRSSSGRSRVGSTSSLRSFNSKFPFSWRSKSTSTDK